MPKYPETLAMAEQALRHVISEHEKILQRDDVVELISILLPLIELARDTNNLLAEGFHRSKSTTKLTAKAREIEKTIDDLSVLLWRPIQVSVSAIYERIEASLLKQEGKLGMRADTRAYYHNLRIRLLEQCLGARMLVSNSDLGDENERIWQQFLERHLGPMFSVLRGGHICDYAGNISSQIDLVIVPAGAHVFVPGDSDDGKVQVFVDHVVSAVMVTSNLTCEKLKHDWENLQSIPSYVELEKDYPKLAGHSWPFCYIVGAQSDTAEAMAKAGIESCKSNFQRAVPQFVVSLDTGFLYGGLRNWPCPSSPSNFTEADHVESETGIHAGLGLAWLLTQQQGRLAVMQRQNIEKIDRFVKLLNEAQMKNTVPPTCSRRFDTMIQMDEIAGVMEWGHFSCWAHNQLQLRSLRTKADDETSCYGREFFLPGSEQSVLDWKSATKNLRLFRYLSNIVSGRLLAIEEWINHSSRMDHRSRVAVFDIVTGNEVVGELVNALRKPSDIELAESKIMALLANAKSE